MEQEAEYFQRWKPVCMKVDFEGIYVALRAVTHIARLF